NAAIHQPAENRSQLFTRVFFSFFIQYDQKASRIQLFFNQPGLSGHLRCLLPPIFLLKLRHWNDLGRKQSMQALHVTVLKFRKQRIFRFSNPKKSEAHGMIETTVYGQTHRLEPDSRSFPELDQFVVGRSFYAMQSEPPAQFLLRRSKDVQAYRTLSSPPRRYVQRTGGSPSGSIRPRRIPRYGRERGSGPFSNEDGS